jgi:4-hydroxy-3-polyprenylbenzoate decarboxylase
MKVFSNELRRHMDMSVKMPAGQETDKASKKTSVTDARRHGANASDLDVWLQKVEAMGELKRITAEVDPDLEAATIAYLVGSEKSPALLFENIKGHPGHRALYNMIGCNLSRFCLMIGEQPVDHPLKAVRALQQKFGRKIPPQEVSANTAICNQNIVNGDAIDIRKFPAQRMWPLDGGMYLGTGDAVITKDPETGRINVGTYRMMIKGPREIGVYTSPGKDAGLDRDKWWKMGKPMPIAAAYGIDPLLFLVAATSLPKTESEYEYYGGINGAPIELFTSDLTGLPLPAGAEIILEGFVYPNETFAEGPFGEFTGYYGRPSGATPFMRVERVRYRDNPTLTCALMAENSANEAGLFWAALRAAGIWADLHKLGVPGIQGVWSIPEAAGWGITVVSITQMYAGHAAQVMALAAQCTAGAYFGKYVIVVDDDIDPTNVHQVLWAMATRSRPAQAIDILRETWSTYLDPSLNPPELRPWGSKCLINACMEYKFIKTYSKRARLSKKTYEKVVGRWQELGLSGKAPVITNFEDESTPAKSD